METEEEKTKEPKDKVIENDSENKSDLTKNIAADKERVPIEITGDKQNKTPQKVTRNNPKKDLVLITINLVIRRRKSAGEKSQKPKEEEQKHRKSWMLSFQVALMA